MVRVSLSGMSLRGKSQGQNEGALGLEIHPLESTDGLIVKVLPPKQPPDTENYHVPCDIVLVIDISGSMGRSAPVPTNPGETQEDFGLSILDLVKHASRTILETLGPQDRLGIVTFTNRALVVQGLTPMDKRNKQRANEKIEGMGPEQSTNLWHGIRAGIELFDGAAQSGRVPAMMVLTDGMPNFMCPPQGYVPKLRGMGQLPATIHTFGFGYALRSGLLKSIAEIGGGDYAFIPDAGMIGTVFVHAVANLQSTFANRVSLKLTSPSYLKLQETTGDSVVTQEPVEFGEDEGSQRQLTISLGNVQYGQSRDIYLRYEATDELKGTLKLAVAGEAPPQMPIVKATLEYTWFTSSVFQTIAQRNITDFTGTMPPAEIAYHTSRSAIISFISSLIPMADDGEHVAIEDFGPKEQELKELIANLPAARPDVADDPRNRSLVEDLCGDAPKGQINIACQPEFVRRWGIHFLPSLAGAHARQVCNSFKDPGPLMYGAESPLFISCRDRLDAIFDSLPAPTPSNSSAYDGRINMSMYHSSSGPCFAGSSRLALATGCSGGGGNPEEGKAGEAATDWTIRIGRLRAGMSVRTPKGPRRVVAVLKTGVRRAPMCLIGGLLVTPWHPVSFDGEGWVFPAHVAHRPIRYTGSTYSVLLERDADVDAHAVLVDGVWGVTLGHGMLDAGGSGDVRAHQFLGSHEMVSKSMAGLQRSRTGVVFGGGVKRDARTGFIRGFKPAPLQPSRVTVPIARKMVMLE